MPITSSLLFTDSISPILGWDTSQYVMSPSSLIPNASLIIPALVTAAYFSLVKTEFFNFLFKQLLSSFPFLAYPARKGILNKTIHGSK